MRDSIAAAGRPSPPSSMSTFLVIWGGQTVSTFGSSLTSFALGVWVYQLTGKVTEFALIGVFAALPSLLVAPLAGALVDRWDRRLSMMLSDGGAAAMTVLLCALLLAGRLELIHIYLAMMVASLFTAFQWPAYAAATTLMVPKHQFGRASGLQQLGHAASQLLAPAAAGFLLIAVRVEGVMLIDVITYGVALATLAWVRIPAPTREAADGEASRTSILVEAKLGWRFIMDRPGLRGLLLFLAMINLLVGFQMALTTPLVLMIASPSELGIVLSVAGAGLVVGSLVMSTYGGPRHRMSGVLLFGLVYGCGFLILGTRASIPVIAAGSFVLMFSVPMINGCSQAIWQSKVPPALQGRVFSVRRMTAQATLPLALLIAGPLADGVFRPAMAEGGWLAGSVGRVFGVGEERGLGVLFVLLGAAAIAATAAARASVRVQRLEEELGDWEEPGTVAEGSAVP